MKPTALVWLRRDLRLADNPALSHASRHAQHVLAVYIHEPAESQGRWQAGGASRWWLHHSLEALGRRFKSLGGALILRQGPALEVLTALVEETGATLVAWNRLYEPAAIERDKKIKAALDEAQAWERAGGEVGNRGREAAEAALEMAAFVHGLGGGQGMHGKAKKG